MPEEPPKDLRIRYDDSTETGLPRPFFVVTCCCDLCCAAVLAQHGGDWTEWHHAVQRYASLLAGRSRELPEAIGCGVARQHVAHDLAKLMMPVISARIAASRVPQSARAHEGTAWPSLTSGKRR